MINLNKTDILKLAELSSLKFSDAEIEALLTDIQNIISYVNELNEIPTQEVPNTIKNQNVFRSDSRNPQSSADLIAQGPETFKTYFVVPKVVDSTKDAS